MWLLDFLVSVYQSVLDWFSDRYWYMRNLVLAVPAYVQSLINLIKYYYGLALQGIDNLIKGFYYTYIAPIIDGLRNELATAFIQLGELYAQVIAIRDNILSIAKALIDNALQWLKDRYDTWIGFIQAKLEDVRQNFIPYALGILLALFPFIGWIQQAAKLINPDNIAKLYAEFQALKNNLTVFISNPLGFILGLIEQVFLDFVKFAIGYALGSVNTNLPPKPNWNNYKRQ